MPQPTPASCHCAAELGSGAIQKTCVHLPKVRDLGGSKGVIFPQFFSSSSSSFFHPSLILMDSFDSTTVFQSKMSTCCFTFGETGRASEPSTSRPHPSSTHHPGVEVQLTEVIRVVEEGGNLCGECGSQLCVRELFFFFGWFSAQPHLRWRCLWSQQLSGHLMSQQQQLHCSPSSSGRRDLLL